MKSFCIIGLGSFGQTLAKSLASNGRQVMVIDQNPQRVNAIADLVTSAVIGDPTNENVLKSSGVRNFDCCINCLYENLSDSILVTLMLKELGIPQVVARAGNERHRNVLEKLGADMVVFPEHDMGENLSQLLIRKNAVDYIELHDGYCMAEITIPHSWVGRSLVQLDLRKKLDLSVISVRHGDGKARYNPDPDTLFTYGDHVTVVGKRRDVDKISGKA